MPQALSPSPRIFRLLLAAALPLACAVGVEPGLEDSPGGGEGGTGGSLGETKGGSSGSGNAPTAGKTSSGGNGASPFGGSSSTAGKSGGGGGTGGMATGGGGAGGSAGSGTAGSGGGGSGSGCACAKTLPWVDNTSMSWVTGDCVSTGGMTYLYTGTKAQTYANGPCNPAKQEAWCADMGNDYKFMACP